MDSEVWGRRQARVVWQIVQDAVRTFWLHKAFAADRRAPRGLSAAARSGEHMHPRTKSEK